MSRLLVKMIVTAGIVMLFLYTFTRATPMQIVASSVVFTILAFLIGDQLILRVAGNTTALIADVGLAGFFFWLAAWWYGWDLSPSELTLLVVLIGASEWVFHNLLRRWNERGVE